MNKEMVCTSVFRSEKKTNLAVCPRRWQANAIHWVKHTRVLWLPGLVVKEILSVCQLKKLRARITLTLRISSGNAGIQMGRTKKKKKNPNNNHPAKTERAAHSDRDLTRSTCSTGKCVTECGGRRKHRTRHAYWNGLNLIRHKECSSGRNKQHWVIS